MTLIAPSILSADFAKLAEAAQLMEQGGADWLHVDVMDGHFVPNITIGPVVVKSLKKHTRLPMDVHMMISDPLKYAEPFAKAGAWSMTFHIEAVKDPGQVIREFKRLGCKAGMSIKPGTPASAAIPFLDQLDVLLVMTVEPGFGGQAFMANMVPKITELKNHIRKNKLSCLVEIDGGIDPTTAVPCIHAGADVLVAGHAIFGQPDPVAALKVLKNIAG